MKILKQIALVSSFTLLFMNTQCDEDDAVQMPCGQTVVIDSGFYESAESDSYELLDTSIEGNCLITTITASGCDGNTWSVVLVDSGNVAESFPEQRFLKLVFTNTELCDAVISQERSFDLTALQINGSSEVILNIEGMEESLSYLY